MISLNHAEVEPAQAREIVKYLADNHGLAPEEAKTVAFEAERRLVIRATRPTRRRASCARRATRLGA